MGTIGGIAHETIRRAAQQMVQIASQFQHQMKQTIAFPLPQKGETIFYLLTDGGVFFASALETTRGGSAFSFTSLSRGPCSYF